MRLPAPTSPCPPQVPAPAAVSQPTTDASGNFFFPNPPIGEQVILLDGPTSLYPADLAIPATIASGAANELPYPIYLHEISQNFTSFTPGQKPVRG